MKLKILLEDCWSGYKQVGMKEKNGKEVPNCVPANESIIKEAGVNKMYVKYLAVQKKVAELVNAQLRMKDAYFAETNPTKKASMMVALKKGTDQLQMWRRNLQKIEDKYILNLDKDAEYTGDF
jgi:hypothetical protein